MAHTSITIVLELDEATDSPSGLASLADGTSREFHGWLGLAAAIDSLARAPVRVAPADSPTGTETPGSRDLQVISALVARERLHPTTTRKDSS